MEKLTVNNEEFFAEVIDLLKAGDKVTIPVKGYSMLPFIKGERDLVILEDPSAEGARPLAVGDIVLFRFNGGYRLHRIIRMSGDNLDIMGDGILKFVEKTGKDSVCARAVTIVKAGKKDVDPYSPWQSSLSRTWRILLPVRRYILYAWKILPWNFWIYREQHEMIRKQQADNR